MGTTAIYIRVDDALAQCLKNMAFSRRISMTALCIEILSKDAVATLPSTPTVRIEGNAVYKDEMTETEFQNASHLFAHGRLKNGDPIPGRKPATPAKKGGKRAKAP